LSFREKYSYFTYRDLPSSLLATPFPKNDQAALSFSGGCPRDGKSAVLRCTKHFYAENLTKSHVFFRLPAVLPLFTFRKSRKIENKLARTKV